MNVQLPSHWKTRRLKFVASVQLSNVDKKSVEGEASIRLCNYVDVYKNDFITPDMEFMEATASARQIRDFSLKAGDVLITKDSEAWNDIAVPALVTSDLDGVLCGYHLAHIRPNPEVMAGGFLFRAIDAEGIADQFRVAANGITRFGIGKDEITGALFPVPPLAEQRAIAEFLDRKTAQIDGVIAKKRRMIDLLHENRQALISEAVTKGLDPDVPTKDSGIPGLRRIPASWIEIQLRHLIVGGPKNGISPQPAQEGEGVPSFSVAALRNGKVNILPHVKYVALDATSARPFRVQTGDLLVMRGNANLDLVGTCGIVGDVPDGCTYPDILIRLTPSRRVHRDFLVAAMNSRYCRWQIEASAKTSNGTYKVSGEELSELCLALPPFQHQDRICNYIDRSVREIDTLSAKLESQITKLREYRQTLISAAVTGQIDVTTEGQR